MTDVTTPYDDGRSDDALAALGADGNPADADLARRLAAGAVAFVWAPDGTLLWRSAGADELARVVLDDAGKIDAAIPFGARVRSLAAGAAALSGTRLERLRIGRDRLAAPITLACRRLAWTSGEALLTIVLDGPWAKRAVSRLEPASRVPPADTLGVSTMPPLTPDPTAQSTTPTSAGAAPLRFVWASAEDGRFTFASDSLVRLVGPAGADIVGRHWSEIVGDPTGAVAAGFGGGRAWRLAPALWRHGRDATPLPVSLSGVPATDAEGRFAGFRGFGTGRPADLAPAEPDIAVSVLEPAAADIAFDHDARPTAVPDAPPDDTTAFAQAADTVSIAAPIVPDGDPAGPDELVWEEAVVAAFESATPVAATPVTPHEPQDDAIDMQDRENPAGAALESTSAETAAFETAIPARPEPATRAASATSSHLHPMFQVFLDASLSGLTHLLSALPEPQPRSATPGRGQAAPPNVDAMPPRATFEAMGAAVGAQLGGEIRHPFTPEGGAAAKPPDRETAEPGDRTSSEISSEPAASGDPAVPPHAADDPTTLVPGSDDPIPPMPAADPVEASSGANPPDANPPDAILDDAILDDPVRTGDDGSGTSPVAASPGVLSFAERGAFHEIARALGARRLPDDGPASTRDGAEIIALPPRPGEPDLTRLLERLPVGAFVHRETVLLFANRRLLDELGYDDLAGAAAGLPLVPGGFEALSDLSGATTHLPLVARSGLRMPAEQRTGAIEWQGGAARLTLAGPRVGDPAVARLEGEMAAGARRLAESAALVDLASDALVTLDDLGRILSLNRSAAALFGYAPQEVTGEGFALLLAPESHRAALAAVEAARAESDVQAVALAGRGRDGEPIPLVARFGRAGVAADIVIGVALQDVSALRRGETERSRAERAAARANRQTNDVLARLSHEVRTPLNAIIGFAEMMLDERFGPVGTERYKTYLHDIRDSGTAVIGLLDDLLDLARAMSGPAEIPADGIDLNGTLVDAVAGLQPLAARGRIVLRTSFAPDLATLRVAAPAIRQAATNLLTNAIRFTQAGGQVIVSTAMSDTGEIALRIRDTGIGMSEAEIEAALEPFRQVSSVRASARPGHAADIGRGLGLPLARALVQAHRGTLSVTSRPAEGTLVEVVFPAGLTLPTQVQKDPVSGGPGGQVLSFRR